MHACPMHKNVRPHKVVVCSFIASGQADPKNPLKTENGPHKN